MNRQIIMIVCVIIIHFSCNYEREPGVFIDEQYQKELQEQLITADSGAVIEIPEGYFSFSRSISLDGIPGVTIKGKGQNKTVLSFKYQIDGSEGMLITADNVHLEGFTIQDSRGDGLKLRDCRNVVIKNIKTTWTGGAKETNGGYGIYPVSCTNLLIEDCEASYASDAGIYLGQSNHGIVRNNIAHHNVAGIEIENCTHVEAYGNLAENNSGGFLVFDLPDLPQANGSHIVVYENEVRSNNHKNFAPEGGMVHTLPPGTGIILIAAKNVEVYNNTISDHKTVGISVVSYQFTERPFNRDNGFNPYYYNVFIHDNEIERRSAIPDLSKRMGKMVNAVFTARPQDIVVDGILAPEEDMSGAIHHLCLQNNGEEIRFANLNASTAGGIGDLRKLVDKDVTVFDCEPETLHVQVENVPTL